MSKLKILCLVAFCLLAFPASVLAAETQPEDAALSTSTFSLGPMHIHEKFISMTGPIKTDHVSLAPVSSSHDLWVKSFRVDVVDDMGKHQPSEYLCH